MNGGLGSQKRRAQSYREWQRNHARSDDALERVGQRRAESLAAAVCRGHGTASARHIRRDDRKEMPGDGTEVQAPDLGYPRKNIVGL